MAIFNQVPPSGGGGGGTLHTVTFAGEYISALEGGTFKYLSRVIDGSTNANVQSGDAVAGGEIIQYAILPPGPVDIIFSANLTMYNIDGQIKLFKMPDCDLVITAQSGAAGNAR